MYDCVISLALAAIVAGLDRAGGRSARSCQGVTAGGRTCSTFAHCVQLLAAGEDIDYDGTTGTHRVRRRRRHLLGADHHVEGHRRRSCSRRPSQDLDLVARQRAGDLRLRRVRHPAAAGAQGARLLRGRHHRRLRRGHDGGRRRPAARPRPARHRPVRRGHGRRDARAARRARRRFGTQRGAAAAGARRPRLLQPVRSTGATRRPRSRPCGRSSATSACPRPGWSTSPRCRRSTPGASDRRGVRPACRPTTDRRLRRRRSRRPTTTAPPPPDRRPRRDRPDRTATATTDERPTTTDGDHDDDRRRRDRPFDVLGGRPAVLDAGRRARDRRVRPRPRQPRPADVLRPDERRRSTPSTRRRRPADVRPGGRRRAAAQPGRRGCDPVRRARHRPDAAVVRRLPDLVVVAERGPDHRQRCAHRRCPTSVASNGIAHGVGAVPEPAEPPPRRP